MRIAVLGAGGVGGLVAAALARDGTDTTVVAREETARVLGLEGLHVTSAVLGDFAVRPRVTARLEQPVDALLVATKAAGLAEGLDRVAAEPALAVPLLNGVEHMATLRDRFTHVAAGAIRVESTRVGTGRILHTSGFLRVDLAGPGVEPLAAALRRASIPTEVRGTEAEVLWGKLVRLNALALVTTAYGTLGEARAHPEAIDGVIVETAAVAAAEGAPVDAARVREELAAVHPDFLASMARDRAAGRPLELDAIAGAVRRAGRRHGIPTPAIDALVAMIEA